MFYVYSNPYYRENFFQFFATLVSRLVQAFSGQLAYSDLVADEIQILVLCGVALSSALVGCFLVLRKMAMLANSLSHTIILGIVLGYLVMHPGLLWGETLDHHEQGLNLTALLLAALGMGIITTFLTELLTRSLRLQEDASTGLVFTSLFALGVVLISLFTRNAHIGTEIIMGNVDALHHDDIKLVFVVFVLNLFIIGLLFKEYQVTTFDAGLAKTLGFSSAFFNYLLMTQVAATTIAAFRAVGVLMVLSLIVGPAITARMLTDRLRTMIGLAMGIGMLCALCGVALSRHILSVFGTPLSTAGLVVCLLVLAFCLALVFSPKQGLLVRGFRRRRWAQEVTK